MFKLLPFVFRLTCVPVFGLIVSYLRWAAAAAVTLEVALVLGRMLPPPCWIGPCYGILVPLRIRFDILIGPVAFI